MKSKQMATPGPGSASADADAEMAAESRMLDTAAHPVAACGGRSAARFKPPGSTEGVAEIAEPSAAEVSICAATAGVILPVRSRSAITSG